MMTRLVSGVALAAAALVAIRFLPLLPLRVLACLVAALAAKEYLEIVDSPIRAVVLVIAVAMAGAGGVVIMAGLRRFTRITPMPERTMASLQENLEWMKQPTK